MNWLMSMMRNNNMTDQLMQAVGMNRKNHQTRNNVIVSLLGVGLGAVAYTMMRNRKNHSYNNNMIQPVQRIMHQIRNPIS